MTPNDDHPKPPTPPADPAGTNGAGANGSGPYPGPEPIPVPPEIIEWALRQDDDEIAAEGLREIFEGRGVSSEELLRHIEEVLGRDG